MSIEFKSECEEIKYKYKIHTIFKSIVNNEKKGIDLKVNQIINVQILSVIFDWTMFFEHISSNKSHLSDSVPENCLCGVVPQKLIIAYVSVMHNGGPLLSYRCTKCLTINSMHVVCAKYDNNRNVIFLISHMSSCPEIQLIIKEK